MHSTNSIRVICHFHIKKLFSIIIQIDANHGFRTNFFWTRRKSNFQFNVHCFWSDWFLESSTGYWFFFVNYRNIHSSKLCGWSVKSWWVRSTSCIKSSHLDWCDEISLECRKSTCIQVDNYSQMAMIPMCIHFCVCICVLIVKTIWKRAKAMPYTTYIYG